MTNEASKPPTSRAAGITVFVSDPTAEAERVSEALRAAGFQVIDVPLSMLVARVAVQRPHVVIVDADAEGAVECVARMREVPECDSVDVLFTGRVGHLPESLQTASQEGEANASSEKNDASSPEEALAFEGSGFFSRPVDPAAVVKKVRALALGTTTVSSQPPARASAPPGADELSPRATSSHPPSSGRSPTSERGASITLKRLSEPPPPLVAGGRGAPLSHRLESLLAEAESRIGAEATREPSIQTPEEEIDAVLPEEVLAALDAPLEDEDDEYDGVHEASSPRVTTAGGSRETTGARRYELTNDGSVAAPKTQGDASSSATTGSERTSGGRSPPTTEAQRSSTIAPMSVEASRAASATETASASTFPRAFGQDEAPPNPVPFSVDVSSRRPASAPPPTAFAPPPSVLSTTLGSELLVQQGGMLLPAKDAPPPFGGVSEAPPQYARASAKAESSPPPPAMAPVVLGPGDALRVLSHSVSSRMTGTLTFESEMGVRRIVLREGDIVTAASGLDAESLLAFLGARGDLPRERVAQLAGRLPPNGRHAGAALVAQGVLGQDQLWPVLRAHAEWLIAQCFSIARGTAHVDPEPPGRLRNEPSVFGGSTGAEVFVEVVRRAVDAEGATRALGGGSSRLSEGSHIALLDECALPDEEKSAIARARGETVAATVAANPSIDIAPLLYALALLGVVEIVRAALPRAPSAPSPTIDASMLDEEAVRERIRARMELVDEGDYFALLGVPRTATSYEVRRAYVDLRRTFDAGHLLTPHLADLADDVRKIAGVLDEAYEILGDAARRERYRRAIEEVPRVG